MRERLDQGFIRVAHAGIFADHRHIHVAVRFGDPPRNFVPARQIGLRRLDAEGVQHLAVQPLIVIGDRHIVDVAHVERLDDGGWAHIAEQRDLAPLLGGHRAIAAA